MDISERSRLIDSFITEVINGMDMDTLVSYAYDCMSRDFRGYTDEQLIAEVRDYYPHLLEDVTV